jgi:hypothetical protein
LRRSTLRGHHALQERALISEDVLERLARVDHEVATDRPSARRAAPVGHTRWSASRGPTESSSHTQTKIGERTFFRFLPGRHDKISRPKFALTPFTSAVPDGKMTDPITGETSQGSASVELET